MALEDLGAGKHDVRAMSYYLAPEFPPWVVYRRGHEPEGASAGIRPNVKHAIIRIRGQPGMSRGERAGMMVGVIFMVVFTRSNEPEFPARPIGAQEAHFAGRMTGAGQKQTIPAARAFHFDSKTLVGLIVEQGIGFAQAQSVPIKPVGAFRRFVLDGVKERAIVRSPCHAGDAFDTLRKSAPGAQVFDLKQVLAET